MIRVLAMLHTPEVEATGGMAMEMWMMSSGMVGPKGSSLLPPSPASARCLSQPSSALVGELPPAVHNGSSLSTFKPSCNTGGVNQAAGATAGKDNGETRC